jgi:hypothetical protein
VQRGTSARSRPIGLGRGRVPFHLAGTACHALGDVITDGLPLAGRRAHRVADALAASLKDIAGAIANVSSRVGQAFADLGGQPRREPDRQARANARTRDDPKQKARASRDLSLFVLTLW